MSGRPALINEVETLRMDVTTDEHVFEKGRKVP